VDKEILKLFLIYLYNKGGKTMRILKAFTSLAVMGVFAVMVLIVTAPLVYATGSAGEPGSDCPNPLLIEFQYVDPPYIGDITAEWILGDVWISGLVEQEGNRGCFGNANRAFFGSMSLEAFQNLKAVDNKEGAVSIKGTCLIGWNPFFNCGEIGYFEIVSIGNLNYSADQKSFTAKVRIKLLQEKLRK
jgi:hypothetical protein